MKLEAKNFSSPDKTVEGPAMKGTLVHVGDHTVGRARMEPGWRWSVNIKPNAGTETCQFLHTGVVTAGTLHVQHESGDELDLKAGDAYVIPPGHDAWVVGDEAYEAIDWGPRIDDFAKGAEAKK